MNINKDFGIVFYPHIKKGANKYCGKKRNRRKLVTKYLVESLFWSHLKAQENIRFWNLICNNTSVSNIYCFRLLGRNYEA